MTENVITVYVVIYNVISPPLQKHILNTLKSTGTPPPLHLSRTSTPPLSTTGTGVIMKNCLVCFICLRFQCPPYFITLGKHLFTLSVVVFIDVTLMYLSNKLCSRTGSDRLNNVLIIAPLASNLLKLPPSATPLLYFSARSRSHVVFENTEKR